MQSFKRHLSCKIILASKKIHLITIKKYSIVYNDFKKGEKKMKITKITACIAVLLTAAVALTTASGCGKDKNGGETTAAETTATADENAETTADADSDETAATDTETVSPTDDATAGEQTTGENTTKKENSTVNEQEITTAANTAANNTDVKDTPAIPSNSEFNIIAGDKFYITGKSIDSDGTVTPLEIAKTAKSLYMLSDFDGIEMGALINGETAYMICPEKKAYLEITSSLRKTMGIDDSQMFDVSSYSFSDLGTLANAQNIEQNRDFQGVSCTAYTFTRETSKTVFFMNGDKLAGFVSANLDGSDPVTTVISKITADVPADKIEPSSSYKGYKGVIGAVRFMAAVGIEQD